MPVDPILTLGVAHAYGAVALPALRPADGLVAWLRGRGLGLRALGERILLYRERDEAGQPRGRLAAPATLRFVLGAAPAAFAAVTDLAALAASPAPRFSNAGLAPADRVELALVTPQAQATETLWPPAGATGTAQLKLAGRPLPTATAAAAAATSPAGAVTVAGLDAALGLVDLAGPGVAAGVPVLLTYPVLPTRPADSLAEIELVIDQALIDARATAGRAADYVVPFAARALRWCYYVVAPSEVAADAVALGVGAPAAEARGLAFAAAGAKRDLTATPDAADPLGQALVARLPTGQRVLRFLADRPVPLRDRPIRPITLDIDGKRLFASLPNPLPDAIGALRAADGITPATEFLHATITATGG